MPANRSALAPAVASRSGPARCGSAAHVFVAITAFICSERNARLLQSTLDSVARHAPRAQVHVFDSGSPWDVAALLDGRPEVRVHRLETDSGQFGALGLVGALKPPSASLLFLQHTTRLTHCVARRLEVCARCSAIILGGHRPISGPFWRAQTLVHRLLDVVGEPLGRAAPPAFHVAEHAAIALDPDAFARASTLGLWRSASTPVLASVRDALSKASALDKNIALEALAGFIVAVSNNQTAAALESSPQAGTPCCAEETKRLIKKEHGGSHVQHACTAQPVTSLPPKPQAAVTWTTSTALTTALYSEG